MKDSYPYVNRTLGPCYNNVVMGLLWFILVTKLVFTQVITTVSRQKSPAIIWVIIDSPTGVSHLDHMQLYTWVCLKIVSTPKANGFADHSPYEMI